MPPAAFTTPVRIPQYADTARINPLRVSGAGETLIVSTSPLLKTLLAGVYPGFAAKKFRSVSRLVAPTTSSPGSCSRRPDSTAPRSPRS